MNKYGKILISGLLAITLAGCGHFVFQGVKYRTGGAHSSSIGSVGLLRGELYMNNIYEPQLTPEWEEMEIATVAAYSSSDISKYNFTSSADINTSTSVEGGLNGGASESSQRYIFELKDKDGLLRQINQNVPLLKKLKSSKNWRIVTSSVRVFDHSLSKEIAASGSAIWTMEGTAGSGVVIKASGSKSVTLQISDGTIVGYQYSRICWGLSSKKAELLLIDRPGVDVSCLAGTTHDPSKI